jgi:hypothetical protein
MRIKSTAITMPSCNRTNETPAIAPISLSIACCRSWFDETDLRNTAVDHALHENRGLARLDAPLVRVEAHVAGRVSQLRIVGLPDILGIQVGLCVIHPNGASHRQEKYAIIPGLRAPVCPP